MVNSLSLSLKRRLPTGRPPFFLVARKRSRAASKGFPPRVAIFRRETSFFSLFTFVHPQTNRLQITSVGPPAINRMRWKNGSSSPLEESRASAQTILVSGIKRRGRERTNARRKRERRVACMHVRSSSGRLACARLGLERGSRRENELKRGEKEKEEGEEEQQHQQHHHSSGGG